MKKGSRFTELPMMADVLKEQPEIILVIANYLDAMFESLMVAHEGLDIVKATIDEVKRAKKFDFDVEEMEAMNGKI